MSGSFSLRFGTRGNDKLVGAHGTDLLFGLAGHDVLIGNNGNDILFGGGGKDRLLGGRDNDRLFGEAGDDKLDGGEGRDFLVGGEGADILSGGSGHDLLHGGAGADRFHFDPSNRDEGADRIVDLTLGSDKIALEAADILRADPDIITKTGDPSLLDATDFDADSSWDVKASRDGDVLIAHPGGTIEVDSVDFGAATDSFAELLPALELKGIVAGTAGANSLKGGNADDAIFGLAGNDTIEATRGDDALVGGDGADRFFFNPNRKGEGDDVILDFVLGTDKIVLRVSDVLASTPGLLGFAGDPNAFEPEDLDASGTWSLGASADGDLLVAHPNGTIELNGVAFVGGLTFRDILPALELI